MSAWGVPLTVIGPDVDLPASLAGSGRVLKKWARPQWKRESFANLAFLPATGCTSPETSLSFECQCSSRGGRGRSGTHLPAVCDVRIQPSPEYSRLCIHPQS